jgi:uncharacterized protein (TIRG00374 family)
MMYLMWNVGFHNISARLRFLGWGLLVLILAEGVAEFFHAISWRFCLSDAHRRIPLLRLFGMSMAGYAISYLTPTASLGGDVTRTALLTGDGKGPEAVSGMLISKLSFALAHLLFVVLGCLLIVPRIALPPALRTALLSGCGLLACGIVAFLWIQKRGKLGAVARRLLRWNFGGSLLHDIVSYINEVDNALKVFYRERPWGLPLAVFWHLAGYLVGIVQVWYFLHLVAGNAEIVPSIKVWFVGLWFDLLTFAVPMNLGFLEGGRIVAFRAVGYEPAVGMAYAVAFRMVQLSFSIVGLASYVLLVSKKSFRKSPSESFKESRAHESI